MYIIFFRARIHFQNELSVIMPFSVGRWKVAHSALSIQRDSVMVAEEDPSNLVSCFRASLFHHSLSTPIHAVNAAEGYMRVLEGHAGHNASLHFCIGILVLSGHPFYTTMTDEDRIKLMQRRTGKINNEKKLKLDMEGKTKTYY